MKKSIVSALLCLFLVAGFFPVTAQAVTTISSVEIINVPQPKAGDPVPVSATVTTAGATLYSMDWYDKTAGRFLESNESFIENHIYEVQLWVEANSGYEFRTNGATPNVSATVGENTAKVSKAYEYQAWAMVVVSYTFDPCPKKEIKSVDIQLDDITKSGNVLLAEEGKGIPFSILSGDEQVKLYPELHTRYFPYGFHWSNLTKDTIAYGERFQGGCDYYVTIALKPRYSDYTFADNFTATIGGKSAQIKNLGKTYAEISVEVTCIGTIVAGNITPVVSLPRDGNAPDYGLTYTSCEHIDYVTVTGWYDVETGTRLLTSKHQFRGGKQYRVEVVCTAAYAYKFQRDANDEMEYTPMITGVNVDSYSFGYDSERGRETITLVKTFTAIGSSSKPPEPQHTHTPSGWRTTGVYHYKACTSCGDMLDQEDHKGGVATCKEKGKCTVCGYAYLEENEDHTPDTSKWVIRGDMYHYHACKLCGAHCDIGDHVPGPAGTPDAAVVCKDCGYVITPAKNHKHNLTKVAKKEATCTETGNLEYYTCDGCSALFADSEGKTQVPDPQVLIIPLAGHTVSDYWRKDDSCHWRICTTCQAVLEETKLVHDMEEETCATCGYTKGGPVDSPEESEKSEDPEQQPQIEDQKNKEVKTDKTDKDDFPWWIIAVVGSIVAFGGAAATIIFLRKKKKE